MLLSSAVDPLGMSQALVAAQRGARESSLVENSAWVAHMPDLGCIPTKVLTTVGVFSFVAGGARDFDLCSASYGRPSRLLWPTNKLAVDQLVEGVQHLLRAMGVPWWVATHAS